MPSVAVIPHRAAGIATPSSDDDACYSSALKPQFLRAAAAAALPPPPSPSTLSTSSSGESDSDDRDDCPAAGRASVVADDDARYPLFLSDAWQRSLPCNPAHTDVAWDVYDEPHLKRKHAILQRHPEVAKLYGHEPATKYIAVALVLIQLAIAYALGRGDAPLWVFFAAAYVVGGTVTAMFGVVVHEAAHNLCHPSPRINRAIGLVANIGLPMPIALSFRRHHLEHHAFQGVHGRDPDLPMAWEIWLIRGRIPLKLVWMFCFPIMYMTRALALGKRLSYWEKVNWVWTVATDALIWHICGPVGLAYIVVSTWLGYGLHPGAAHFIQEHYTFLDGQETYSYYGSGNTLFMNVGYHNEHHDFTTIPWSRLPELKRIAAEFYEPLGAHSSWCWVLWHFLISDELGPQSRVERTVGVHKQSRSLIRRRCPATPVAM